jgi:hypothetical protein
MPLPIHALALLLAFPEAPSTSAAGCSLRPADQAWLDRSVAAWNLTRTKLLEVRSNRPVEAFIFDDHCLLTSRTALSGGKNQWSASPIVGGKITVGTQTIPVGVVSATIAGRGAAHFVMSTPKVWREGKVPPGAMGLDLLMTAVMMHEATHVFQMSTYGKAVERLQREQHLSDSAFNDDAIQHEFGKDEKFSSSIQEEIRLFFAASQAPSRARALELAREARALMRRRERHFFVGKDAYQLRAEDLWLTLEGSGQWSGFSWLQLPQALGGGGISHEMALSAFGKRGNFWSQELGLAITLTVQRLDTPGWKRRLFRDGGQTLLQLLDSSLGAGARAKHDLIHDS